ncbi:reverse transcriptase domain-containing protein [Tanacetum coccineum]
MVGLTEGGGPEDQDDREVTPPPLKKEHIEGHLSTLRLIIKDHNRKNKTDPIQLDFDEDEITTKDTRIAKGKEVVDDDLKKPFKEALKIPLTRRIIEFAGPEYKMPNNIKLYDGTTDPEDHLAKGWFERLPTNNIDKWADLREAFTTRYSVRKSCFKEPHEITKIVRRANESLTTFKERWIIETGFIMGVPEIMKISSFTDSLKCPELAKRFSDKAPKTINEMMKRLDDFVRSEKAFAQTDLPKGETREQHRRSYFPPTRKDDRPFRNHQTTDQRSYDPWNNHRGRDNVVSYRGRDNRPPYPSLRGDYHARVVPILTWMLSLNTLKKLWQPKLRIRSLKEKKRKARDATKKWIDTLITFPPISTEDVSDEPLIVEAEVAGYLVRRIYVDGGASVEVMFEHRFENLSPAIKARLKETQMGLVGFTGEATKPLGKIELEVCFGSEGLCRRTTMKFTVIRAPTPYNVILGRTGLRALRSIPSTIHSMMKFPTPRGIATLVTRSVIISECSRLEKKQAVEEKREEVKTKVVNVTEKILANPTFPDQLIVIGGGLPEACKAQLKLLLKDNMDIFAWEPADMTGVPRSIIEHKLNVNTSIEPKLKKHRVLAPEKSEVVTRDVGEWVKAGIVRPVRYPTWIATRYLLSKGFLPPSQHLLQSRVHNGLQIQVFLGCIQRVSPNSDAREDEEKMAFYTDQGTYCYTKMPFGLKNVKATYQRLIDSTFQSQIERNLEAYVDDMVISNDEKMLLADVAETFDNLRKINMKLNLKKCSCGVEEGKFLGYMVTSEGIRANPKKIRILADLQSPRTLKEMQSLAGKLAALNSIVTSTHDEEVEAVFRSTQPVKVIIDQPIKQILNKTEASKKLAKYAVELGAYNITFKPRNAVKWQAADVLSKLASVAFNHLTNEVLVEVLNERSIEVKEVNIVVEEEGDNWMTPIIQCLEKGYGRRTRTKLVTYGSTTSKLCHPRDPHRVMRHALRTARCHQESNEARILLAHRARRRQEGNPKWGMDILRPLPQAPETVKYVIVAIDYFTKWIEAKPLARITERRELAAIREAKYKTKLEQYYNKKVHLTSFKPGEFVFQKNEASKVED